MDAAFWRTGRFWFFSLGLAMWLVWFTFIQRPVFWYVFGHEYTHWAFIQLFRGEVVEVKVTAQGGYVLTDKSNLLISLAPYFIPFYSTIFVAGVALLGLVVDLHAWRPVGLPFFHGFRWEWLAFWILGVTWGFHACFTVWMIGKDQPDLRSNGTLFSLQLIYFANVLLACALLVVMSPHLGWRGYVREWAGCAGEVWGVVCLLAHWVVGLFTGL
jgi:hypothetical protein